eukprot:gene3753-15034_t
MLADEHLTIKGMTTEDIHECPTTADIGTTTADIGTAAADIGTTTEDIGTAADIGTTADIETTMHIWLRKWISRGLHSRHWLLRISELKDGIGIIIKEQTHEKTEKEICEDEETSSSRNTCDDSVSPCFSVQRNEVDAEPKALTHSKYIRPPVIQEFLRTIVSSDLPKFKKEIHSCIAASLRFDASMDKTQKDHQYMLLNVVDENGKPDLKFIGIGHVTDPGASGHLAALKLGADDTVGFDEVMKVITHLSTDGENKNVGEHRGLWKLLDDDRRKLDIDTPLLKSVCAVHSTANPYQDLCKSVPEIDHLVKKIAAISIYFHFSAKRTSELEKVANVEGLTVRRFLKYFEVRWAEFTAALLDAILCSWQALIKFNVEQCDAEGKKFLKLLINKDNLLLMCFVADLLFLIKVFQKKLQSDSLTIVDIEPEGGEFCERVNKLSTGSLLGGWENEFKERYDEEANKFRGIKLWEKERR